MTPSSIFFRLEITQLAPILHVTAMISLIVAEMDFYEDAYEALKEMLNSLDYEEYEVDQNPQDIRLFTVMHRRWMIYWVAWAVSLFFVPPAIIFLRGFIRQIIGLKAFIVAVAITAQLQRRKNATNF